MLLFGIVLRRWVKPLLSLMGSCGDAEDQTACLAITHEGWGTASCVWNPDIEGHGAGQCEQSHRSQHSPHSQSFSVSLRFLAVPS